MNEDKTQAEHLEEARKWITGVKMNLRDHLNEGYHTPSWVSATQTMLTWAELAISKAEEAE